MNFSLFQYLLCIFVFECVRLQQAFMHEIIYIFFIITTILTQCANPLRLKYVEYLIWLENFIQRKGKKLKRILEWEFFDFIEILFMWIHTTFCTMKKELVSNNNLMQHWDNSFYYIIIVTDLQVLFLKIWICLHWKMSLKTLTEKTYTNDRAELPILNWMNKISNLFLDVRKYSSRQRVFLMHCRFSIRIVYSRA